ncbi:MAG: hypothetical protein AB7K09_26120 [Planctomycetota bacterium]
MTTRTMRLAAVLWADMRAAGQPAAADAALDGDVVLAAQVRLLAAEGHDVVVATTNTRHLDRLVDARDWLTIVP